MSKATGMLVLGVTGGIGTGKSTVARLFADRGARVADADRIVRELYAPGELAQRIAERFGTEVLAPDGSVDRASLGRVVFDSPAARRDLEALVHPAVRAAILARLSAWRDEGFRGVAVVDAALLVEAEGAYPLDRLLVVTAPDELRLVRLEARGMDPEEARRRMAAQTSDEARLAAADLTLANNGTLAELDEAVSALLRDLGRDDGVRSG